MYKADIYSKLSLATGKTPADLERDLELGNGAIGKALERNSKVKPLTIAKIAKLYPGEAKKLGIIVDVVADDTGDIQEPAPIYKATDPLAIMAELLRSNQEDRRMLMQTFQAAIGYQSTIAKLSQDSSDMAASVKEIAQSMNTRLEIVEDDLEDVIAIAQGTQESLIQLFAESKNTSRQEIRAGVNRNVKLAAEKNRKKKKDSQTLAGTQNSSAS